MVLWRKGMTGDIWKKLQTIAVCSDGVFCTGTITNSQIERASLNQIITHNKGMFELLKKGRTSVYRLTGLFYSRYKLNPSKLLFRKLSEQNALKRCVWSAFLIENSLSKPYTEEPFIHEGQKVILDNFSSFFDERVNSVITIEDRYGFFAEKKIHSVIPSACQSKWVRSMFSSIFAEVDIGNGDKGSF